MECNMQIINYVYVYVYQATFHRSLKAMERKPGVKSLQSIVTEDL